MALAGVRVQRPPWWHRYRPSDVRTDNELSVPFVEPLQAPAKVVAVCDDDLPFIRFVERVLKMEGASVIPVTTLDPHEVVRVIVQSQCDSALIDLHMYNDDNAGLTILRMLREEPSTHNMRLRLATGEPQNLRGEKSALSELRVGLLMKPFSIEELLASLSLSSAAFQAA